MRRWIVPALVLAALVAVPVLSGPAAATDVDVTLIAKNVNWHVGNETAAAKPTVAVASGDVLRLEIENNDSFAHTFTLPHFSINDTLAAGAKIYVNITTSSADLGKWQFYCSVPGHTTGTYPNLDGMVGWVVVGTGVTLIAQGTQWRVGSTTKPTISASPGDILVLTITNQDSFAHTFTLPHFGIDQSFAAGATVRVSITTSSADNGTWQFYCAIPGHTTGTYPNLDGMVGWVKVGTPSPPPPTPGFDTVLVVLALVGVGLVARVAVRRKEK